MSEEDRIQQLERRIEQLEFCIRKLSGAILYLAAGENVHPFIVFQLKYRLGDVTARAVEDLLAHLGEMAAKGVPMEPEQVVIELAELFPEQRYNQSFFEELLGAWEPHQFDYLREYMRSKGWKC